MKNWEQLIQELHDKESLAIKAGGYKKQQIQKSKGKLLCRERIQALVDPDSFLEFNMLAETQTFEFDMQQKKILGDGVVTGSACIDNRPILIFAQDVTVFGGSAGKAHGEKINLLLRLARKIGVPIIGLYESAGGRLQDGMQNESGYGQMFFENTQCSGVIPQVAAILGACTGGGVYSPALMDFILQVKETAQMFITGPKVIKAVTGDHPTFEELGGTKLHSTDSGVVHLVADNELHCFDLIKKLLSYLPQNYQSRTPLQKSDDDLNRKTTALTEIVPVDPKKTYDMKRVILEIIDDSDFFEIQSAWAQNIIIGFGRMGGESIGVVANQPRYLGGTIDINAADKAARFIRFCDCFNIPLLILADVPGYLPGIKQEKLGIIRHGAKMLYAFSEATVPKITCVVRKLYGGAIPAMCCHESGADFMLAWPTAEFAMMGSEAAVNILYKNQIEDATNPDTFRKDKIAEYHETIVKPYFSASKQYIDAVIHPEETRIWFIKLLKLLKDKTPGEQIRKKHGNIPL